MHPKIVAWTPPEWVCNCFPQTAAGQEVVRLDELVAVLHSLADTATEADVAPLQKALHVSHILVTLQGADGKWPAVLNLRTAASIGMERTTAPLELFRLLDERTNLDGFGYLYSYT